MQVEYLPVITPHENRKESAARLAQRVSLICSRIYSSAIWTKVYFSCVLYVVAYQNILFDILCRIHGCFQLLLINVLMFSIIEIQPGNCCTFLFKLFMSLSLVWSSLLFLSFHTVWTKNAVALFLQSWVWHAYEYFIFFKYTRVRNYTYQYQILILVNKSMLYLWG